MLARVLGVMVSTTVLTVAAGAFAQQVNQDVNKNAAAVQKARVSPAVLSVITPQQAERMGRDLAKNPDPKRAGAGIEQPQFGWHKTPDGRQYLVTVYMQSDDRETNPKGAHMKIACKTYEMFANEPPKEVASTIIQEQEGRRTAHHPVMPKQADDKGRFPVLYGNDYMQNSPSTYATVVDHMCNKVAAPVRISVDYKIDDGNAGGATQPQPFKMANGQTGWVATHLVTNAQIDLVKNGAGGVQATNMDGNPVVDDDIVYLDRLWIEDAATGPVVRYGFDLPDTAIHEYTNTNDNTTPPTVTPVNLPAKSNPAPIVIMADIGRGSKLLEVLDDGQRYVVCAPWGNNRPSERIECTVGEINTSKVLWRGFVLVGNDKDMTMRGWNQATIAKIGPNRIALHALATSMGGKNTDVKGATTAFTFAFEVGSNHALTKLSEFKGSAVHSPHSSICSGLRGVDGTEQQTIFVVSQPHTAVGPAGGSFLGFDQVAKTLGQDARRDRFRTAWYADGQLFSNYFGENPMEQGRNYTHCIGDVPNLGYGVDKGWMKDVKTFFVTGANGRQPGFARNAYWLSFVPGVSKYAIDQFDNPVAAGEAAVTPTSEPTPPAPAPKSESSSGCGCSTPGSTNSSNFAGGLLLLGLALGGIAARRRS